MPWTAGFRWAIRNTPDFVDNHGVNPPYSIPAIILCGGRSRRMGSPKEWLSLGGEMLLQRVVRLVLSVASPVIVAARKGQSLPELPEDVHVVYDEVDDHGPLMGLQAGLKKLGEGNAAAFVTGCDYPFLAPSLIPRMVALCDDETDAVVTVGPSVGGHAPPESSRRGEPGGRKQVNPLPGVYRTSILPTIAEALASMGLSPIQVWDQFSTGPCSGFGIGSKTKGLSLCELLKRVRTKFIPVETFIDCDPELRSFSNLNNPPEYQSAARMV